MPKEPPKTRQEQIALLEQRISQSGLSARQFAMTVLIREERTLRRWIAGESPIPAKVLEFLTEPWEVPWPKDLINSGSSEKPRQRFSDETPQEETS